ncbi:hypothetical protein [Sediminibacterium sp. C3]|uniref:hypothetical protein n=1 Tax=Sediminibacterium sp. C3 TaxID=1267211 RepID=UPI00042A0FCD|nr:hypothetical protein [Sediminibacterium sp. C3]
MLQSKLFLSVFVLSITVIGGIKNAATAQQYLAMHGSSYAGVSSIFNNPASIGNSVHRWDLQLFSAQTAFYTNTLYARTLNITNLGADKQYMTNGFQDRRLDQNSDLSLLSAMYRINKKHAVAIAFRGKFYQHIQTNAFHYQDSASSLQSFFKLNRNIPFLQGRSEHSGWGELNLSYAGAIAETENSRLTAGASLQISKSLGGAYMRMNGAKFREDINGIDTSYTAYSGVGEYAYSANIDVLQQFGITSNSVRDFVKQSKTSMGISAGLEYIVYNDESYKDNRLSEGRPYSYKIGFSLMDIGAQRYTNSEYTGRFTRDNDDVSDSRIANIMRNVNNTRDFKDSMTALFDSIQTLPASFNMVNPARAIVNVDKWMGGSFFINAQLIIHLNSRASATKLNTNEMGFLAVTPRWETLNWGVFLPMQLTRDGQFWTGLAFKAGPLIAGIHNIGIVKQWALLNGGGYIMLNLHPFRKKISKTRMDCFE